MADLIHNPDTHKLGKKEPGLVKHWFHDIIDVERVLATRTHHERVVPGSAGWSLCDGTKDQFQMYLNNDEGDCTCAAVGNLSIAQSDGKTVITDADAQDAYIAVTGKEGAAFDPATGANDNGCVEVDVLDYWALTPIGVAGQIAGHAGVQLDPVHLQAAAQVFGGLYAGWQLATEQQSQTVWDYVQGSSPGSWGGHATPIVGFNLTVHAYEDANGTLGRVDGENLWEIVTWGAVKYATAAFIEKQLDEAHIVITPAWVQANAANPAVNMQALVAALGTYTPES